MRFVLEIELGNDAMRKYADIRRALKSDLRLDGKVTIGDGVKIFDLNGNCVGHWEITD